MKRGWLLAGLIAAACGACAEEAPSSAPSSASSPPAAQAKARPRPAAKAPARPAPAAAEAQPAQSAAESFLPSPEAERQLQAIRDALVESTLSAPVRVQSFGWIDTEGRLHESTQFTSDARVRGVRLPAYVQDPAATAAPKVEVDARVLPAGVGPRAAAAAQAAACEAPARRWRQGLHVQAEAGPGIDAASAPSLAGGAQRAFIAAARDSRRWLAGARPYQPATPYERALVGREADRTEWLARIELARAGDGLRARVEVAPLGRPAHARQAEVALPHDAADAPGLAAAMRQALAALERESACEPLWYSVLASGDSLQLREGAAHGLQAGDRLLLVERQHLPGRLLEPGAVRALALVQVARPTESGTVLRWLAGPRPAATGDWVALPL